MRKAFILFSLCLISFIIRAQDFENLINQGRLGEAGMNDIKALQFYTQAFYKQPQNIYVLCKCSELNSRIAARFANDKKMMTGYHEAAKLYAMKALQTSPVSSEANFVMALVEGRDALIKSGRQKIEAVKDLRKFAQLAIKYDAGNYKAWHILGKWYCEISELNILERSAVKIFFGALPDATINDAIIAFERSKHLNPALLLNYFELAIAYKKNSEDEKALQQLRTMLKLPQTSQDDAALVVEAGKLLKKWERS